MLAAGGDTIQGPGPASIGPGRESITWSYRQGSLRISNKGVNLNCCGKPLHAELMQEGARWIMREAEDRVIGHGGICGCTCRFDFVVETGGVEAGPISLTITRDLVRPSYGESRRAKGAPVWHGTVNLAEGSGVIDPSAGFGPTPEDDN